MGRIAAAQQIACHRLGAILGDDQRLEWRGPRFFNRLKLFLAGVGRFGIAQFFVKLGLAALQIFFFGIAHQRHVLPPRGHEGRDHLVIIARGHRIKLVIVAAGALKRQAEHRLAGGADEIVHLIVAIRVQFGLKFGVRHHVRAGGDEAGGHACLRIIGGQLIAGKL